MKKILITGKNSYVGTSFEKWVSQFPDQYSVDMISMREETWKDFSFKGYDVVLHTVGIAHVEAKPEMESLYYKVNRDLAIETATKAKNDGVNQFIFMSSIIVYGDSSDIKKRKVINEKTIPNPTNFYGNSKLQAEKGIKVLGNKNYKVAIIRPPMIYGKNSKGNYMKLAKFARKAPLFPNVENQRSMLHIDNLSEFVRLIIDNEDTGVFFPQNKEYVTTSEMVQLIAKVNKKRIILTSIFNPLLIVLSKKISIINKIFGSLIYEQSLSKYEKDYQIRTLKESIVKTEL